MYCYAGHPDAVTPFAIIIITRFIRDNPTATGVFKIFTRTRRNPSRSSMHAGQPAGHCTPSIFRRIAAHRSDRRAEYHHHPTIIIITPFLRLWLQT
jgi:hypothetical protein